MQEHLVDRCNLIEMDESRKEARAITTTITMTDPLRQALFQDCLLRKLERSFDEHIDMMIKRLFETLL